MKQFQFDYDNIEKFTQGLLEFKRWCDSNPISEKIFQIYSGVLDSDIIYQMCDVVERIFPDTLYMGCSTSGNIIDCQISGSITAVCTRVDMALYRAKQDGKNRAVAIE